MAGGRDGYWAKFDSLGIRQYATYYGGTGDDATYNIAIDTLKDVYMVGVYICQYHWYSNLGGIIKNASGGGIDVFHGKIQ